ncbi:MAG: hypothetical protein JWO71_3147 [Candidatus Acidoferrum typicum]|nr:hypothetical protein [Candidatus Acidoferrum typicum]
MAELRIQRLDVRNYRGISFPKSLLFGGKSILLFGENGTGKSSFIDALEKVLTGRVSTLDARGQGISSQTYGPHLRSRSGDCEIAVLLSDTTTLDLKTSDSTLSSAARDYAQAARQPVYILRRGQLLAFIESQARDRYDLLRPYLSLEEVEKVEAEFAEALNQSGLQSEAAKRTVLHRSDELRRMLDLRGSTEPLSENVILQALNRRLRTAGRPILSGLGEIPVTIATLNEELSQFGDISKPVALSTFRSALTEIEEAVKSLDFGPLLSSISKLRAREAIETQVIYEKVLEEGAEWIEREKRTECPLCEQAMQRFAPDEVVRRARARVEEKKELLSLRQQLRAQLTSLMASIASHINNTERARNLVAKLPDGLRDRADHVLAALLLRLNAMEAELRKPVAELTVDALQSSIAQLQADHQFTDAIRGTIESAQEALDAMPSLAIAQNLLESRELLTRASSDWSAFIPAEAALLSAESLSSQARVVYDTFQQARKEIISELFEEISDDVDRLYHELHEHHDSGERRHATHRNLRLELREAVQRSVNLRGDFYEASDIDPRAYYSDAHLDTLGISIFLALRLWYRRQHPSFNLMVLDDVISSVDSGHAVQLAELLLREFADFQILLTTHDRIWFEHLRDIQARCGVAQNFVNKTIYKWTIEEGPDLREPADEERRLRELLSDGQTYEMASLAGRLLEHILQEMRYSLRLPVPAKPGELYEIGELWPPFYKEMARNFSRLYSEGKPIFDALDVSWPLRNWVGAHFNRWALNVPRNVAREFAQAVISLFELLFCPECRRFVAPSSTPLGQIACRCGHKIYPALGKQAAPSSLRTDLITRSAGVLKDAKLSSDLHIDWKKSEGNRER